MKNMLLVVDDTRQRQVFPLGSRAITIGRDPSNVVSLEDAQLSRHHCVLERKGEDVVLTDLGSRNGTKLNGRKVVTTPIHVGDIIKIGQLVFEIREDQAAHIFGQGSDQPTSAGAVTVDIDGNDEVASHQLFLEYNLNELKQISSVLTSLSFQAEELQLINARGEVTAGTTKQSYASGESLLRSVLHVAMQARATDVHIEPKMDSYVIRLRVDGTMVTLITLQSLIGARLARVVKVLADLDITVSRSMQDGHFSVRAPDRFVDYRASFAPVVNGQKLVLRVLDPTTSPQHISDLGMPTWMEKLLRDTISREGGMVLVCGPTGSGKSTTLYSIIRDIDVKRKNVITIEDPVEYQIDGVTQIPIEAEKGNTFTSILRSVLRQDPDVLLLGEIRDAETARIAMQAASTGHLVLSTVHAKDVMGVFFRLMDLGIEPRLLASALNVIIAQRLVRVLCPACSKPTKPTFEEMKRLGQSGEQVKQIHRPVGCTKCLREGYAGRKGIYEMLGLTQHVRDALLETPTLRSLKHACAMSNFQSLVDSGAELIRSGITSLEEIDRVATISQ